MLRMSLAERAGTVPSPRLVILNGVPSSGKTALARALQTALDQPWLHVDLDAFDAMLPPSRAQNLSEDAFHRIAAGCNAAVAAIVEAGNNVLLELVARTDNPAACRILVDLFERLAPVETIVVGMTCGEPTALRREAARPSVMQGLVSRDYRSVAVTYSDVIIDSDRRTIEESVADVQQALSAGPSGGFDALLARLRSDINSHESGPPHWA